VSVVGVVGIDGLHHRPASRLLAKQRRLQHATSKVEHRPWNTHRATPTISPERSPPASVCARTVTTLLTWICVTLPARICVTFGGVCGTHLNLGWAMRSGEHTRHVTSGAAELGGTSEEGMRSLI
jgi:hypothetical protein